MNAGCAKLETKPCSTGSLTATKTMGMELVACRSARVPGVAWPIEYVGRERHWFCCVSPYAAGVAPTKACLDLDVAAVCPS
jgi:hypothetical protein